MNKLDKWADIMANIMGIIFMFCASCTMVVFMGFVVFDFFKQAGVL